MGLPGLMAGDSWITPGWAHPGELNLCLLKVQEPGANAARSGESTPERQEVVWIWLICSFTWKETMARLANGTKPFILVPEAKIYIMCGFWGRVQTVLGNKQPLFLSNGHPADSPPGGPG